MLQKLKQTIDYLKTIVTETPDYAIVLGSGLGKLENEVDSPIKIPYEDIPNFPQTTVVGHNGRFIYGEIEGKKVLMMAGRFHYYEGYSMQEVTFPIRVFHQLGIKKVILSNASGGVNKSFSVGDIMILNDHINMMPEHPLRGKNEDSLGPRFVDMSEPYDREMLKFALDYAENNNIKVHQGVYISLQGPTFETPAEYGMIRALGGDAVGMSTVPEVIVAKHQGMRVFCVSVITDLGGPEISIPVSHEEVLNAANTAMPTVISLVKGLIREFEN